MQATIVIGHKNPDTDSICSAIGYAELKRRATGENFLACRAGEINSETQFVLDRFSVQPPKLITSLEPKLGDVYFRRIKGINEEFSLKQAWEHMQNQSVRAVPILTPTNKVKGILTTGDEARFYMEDQDACALSKSAAPYRNIAMTVQAGHRHNCWVGICGELGADTSLTETFMRMGLDELSVNPGSVLGLRKVIRSLDLSK